MDPAIAQTLLLLGQLILAAVALVISIYLLLTERRAGRVQTHQAMLESFNELQRIALENDDNLQALAEVAYPQWKDKPADFRRFLLGLRMMNSLEQLHVARKHKSIDAELADNIITVLMATLVQNQVVRDFVINRGTYDKELVSRARDFAAVAVKSAAKPQPPAQADDGPQD
jgi:hypothetical protein